MSIQTYDMLIGGAWVQASGGATFDSTDPATGQESKIIAVPTARYMGNEDGRGGFGALQYDKVMSQIAHANTDPDADADERSDTHPDADPHTHPDPNADTHPVPDSSAG